VGEIEPSDLRISDTEREQAIRLLGEHMSVGRLDVDECGERSARAAAAKTRRELTELFADLPGPRPTFGAAAAPAPAQPPGDRAPRAISHEERMAAQRVWGAMVPLSAILAVVLFFTVAHVWFIFLLPAVVTVLGGAVWGDDWRHDRRDLHHRMRDQRRQLRRGWHD
jgi:hypothetical protein